ncbi:MAG: agmatinase [Candidatus Omnitrophota bacterium]|nr:MAG: agmatinase [Candidatus Omnitrophota bacterium]
MAASPKEMSKIPDNFGALEDKYSEYKKSKVAIIPIPYEITTTYIKGTKKAPRAIIEASKNMELYDEELDRVVADIGISTLAPLKITKKPGVMVSKVKTRCLKVLNDNKFPVVIGGEHSISIGSLFALKEKYPDISVLSLDAHADLRGEYEGSKYNHACVMARIREHCDAVQAGVRSLSFEESETIKENHYKVMWAKDKTNITGWVKEILDNLNKDVYITVDTDVFDPSLIPAVGTPEPGGLDWDDVLTATKAVFKEKNVVGFDVVELCPDSTSKTADFITAKLIYKMLGYKFFLVKKRRN